MSFDGGWGTVTATFFFSLLSGVIPILNVEAYLLSVSALAPGATLAPVVLAAAAGQMAAKSLLYLSGRGLLRLPMRRAREQVDKLSARIASFRGGSSMLVLVSAVTGIPPFYGVSLRRGRCGCASQRSSQPDLRGGWCGSRWCSWCRGWCENERRIRG